MCLLLNKSELMKGELCMKFLKIIDKRTFFPPAILLLIATCVGIFFPETLELAANKAFEFTTKGFGWFYALGSSCFVIFCLWAGFSKYGSIRLGGKDAKPEMSFAKWFAIALTSGIAIGIVFYGVAEPLTNFTTPPIFSGLEANSPGAAEAALSYTYMHWAIHPYAIYTTAGLCLAFIYYNGKRKYQLSSALYPLIGEKADGKFGSWINAIAIFALVGGIGTSLGIGVLQAADGINYVLGTSFESGMLYAVIIGVMVLIYVAAACTGLHKGIALVSNLNVYVYIILLVWGFLFGGTLFILNNTFTGIGQYLSMIVRESFYLEPAYNSGWVNANTIFYYAWWITFAPMVGLFLVKLAKGRTIKEFVIVNLVAPVVFTFIWFGVFGSSAINMELLGSGGIVSDIGKYGVSVALFSYLKNLPLAPIMIILGFAAIVFSFVTLAESQTLTIAEITCKEEMLNKRKDKSAPSSVKIFWGVLMGLMAFALLQSGGLNALQTAVIVCGLPILILMIFMAIAYVKSMINNEKFDKTLDSENKDVEIYVKE